MHDYDWPPSAFPSAKGNSNAPSKTHIICGCALIVFGMCTANPGHALTLRSPNGRVELNVDVVEDDDQSSLMYSVSFDGDRIMGESAISFIASDGGTIGDSVRAEGDPKFTSHDSAWQPIYGEQSTIRDNYNQLAVDLFDDASGHRMQVTFRCYDAGVAFRTVIKASDADSHIHLSEERSEFRFTGDHTAWCTVRPQDQFQELRLSEIEEPMERPLTIKVNDECYAAITEAALVDYASMKLRRTPDDPLCLVSVLEGDVQADKELSTPWRVVMLGNSPGELLENDELVLNLSEPCALRDTSWIKPGKTIREITLSTEGAKACVDFAVKHNLQYVEFDAGWYGHEYSNESDATTVTVDPERSNGPLDLHYIIDYAAQRGIGIIVYVNQRTLERQLDEILPLYESWGIKGVKYGFVKTGPQKWNRWLLEAVRKAAAHHLMVDIHDHYRPTGYSRTYPNLMTQEGVRGDEAAPSSAQAIVTLFTRSLAGAADHTICYFDPRVTEHWTHGHQLAKAVCTYSPWQFVFWYDTPLHKKPPGNHRSLIVETPELEFFAKVPTVWDETRVLYGEIGQYAVIARRSGQDWFVGAMNNSEERELDVPLDFLDPEQRYNAHIYSDDPSVQTATHVRIEERLVAADGQLDFALKPNGGEAVWLTPSKQSTTSAQIEHGGRQKHLFILSGQSNMARLDPDVSFVPTVEATFGKENVTVVKDAQGGQPIRRWYKNWVSASGERPQSTGDLYDRLMRKVNAKIEKQRFDTVTFVWMQGESDARKQEGDVYADSLRGLIEQLSSDLRRHDINVVIGRISDFDMHNQEMKHWTKVRQAQVEFAESWPRCSWVDTDDLNDGMNKSGKPITNDLHYSVKGYEMLGKRFANQAIDLIARHGTTLSKLHQDSAPAVQTGDIRSASQSHR